MLETAPASLLPADREQSERLHTFAHDVKNRLSSLWEAMRILSANGPASPERASLIDFVERTYLNAQRDVETLLDDLHVERGIRAQPAQPFDANEALQEALAQEAYRYEKKTQRTAVTMEPGVRARGDRSLSVRILTALLSNASKFAPREATITVSIAQLGDEVVIDVNDPGAGLNLSDLHHLFERYALLSSRSTEGEPQARGTLARARQWARAQGGTLTAQSDGHGKGARFRLTLPAA